MGWNPNGGALLYLFPPVSYAKHLKNTEWSPTSSAMESLYPRLYSQRRKDRVRNIKLLQQHSSRHSPLWFKVFLKWYIVIAVIVYVLIIPLTAAYTFHPKCLTRSQVLGRLWVLSIIAGAAPPFIAFFVPSTMYHRSHASLVSSYGVLILLWLFHHFVLPYVVFKRCVGESIYWIILPEFCLGVGILAAILPD